MTHGSIGRTPGPDRFDTGHAGDDRADAVGLGSVLDVEADLEVRTPIAEPLGEVLEGPLPDQPPGGEDPDPVAHRLDLVEQVARQQDRHPALVHEPAEQVEDLDDADRVDRGGRLVEDEHVRILDERVGDAEALEHAPRVRVHAVVGAVGQADLLEHLIDRGVGLGGRDAVELRRVAQVLAAGHVAVEPDAVGHVPHAPLDLERATGRIESDDTGRALGGFGQAEEHEDRRGLARAVLAEQPEDLAGVHLEVEVIDGDEVTVVLGQAAGADPDRVRRRIHAARHARDRGGGQSAARTSLWSDARAGGHRRP